MTIQNKYEFFFFTCNDIFIIFNHAVLDSAAIHTMQSRTALNLNPTQSRIALSLAPFSTGQRRVGPNAVPNSAEFDPTKSRTALRLNPCSPGQRWKPPLVPDSAELNPTKSGLRWKPPLVPKTALSLTPAYDVERTKDELIPPTIYPGVRERATRPSRPENQEQKMN